MNKNRKKKVISNMNVLESANIFLPLGRNIEENLGKDIITVTKSGTQNIIFSENTGMYFPTNNETSFSFPIHNSNISNKDFTVSVNIRLRSNTYTDCPYPFAWYNSNNIVIVQMEYWMVSTRKMIAYIYRNGSSSSSSPALLLNLNEFHHITILSNGRFYFNGIYMNTYDIGTDVKTKESIFYISWPKEKDSRFTDYYLRDVDVSNLAIFNDRLLSDEEIYNVYRSGYKPYYG